MNNQLMQRVIQAKLLAQLAKVVNRDRKGRVTCVYVPASNGTTNKVLIKRGNNGQFRTECYKLVDGGNMVPCFGNRWVCRHSLAALILAIEEQGYIPRFRKSYQQAVKFAKAHKDRVMALEEPIIFSVNRGTMYFVAEDQVAKEFEHASA